MVVVNKAENQENKHLCFSSGTVLSETLKGIFTLIFGIDFVGPLLGLLQF